MCNLTEHKNVLNIIYQKTSLLQSAAVNNVTAHIIKAWQSPSYRQPLPPPMPSPLLSSAWTNSQNMASQSPLGFTRFSFWFSVRLRVGESREWDWQWGSEGNEVAYVSLWLRRCIKCDVKRKRWEMGLMMILLRLKQLHLPFVGLGGYIMSFFVGSSL